MTHHGPVWYVIMSVVLHDASVKNLNLSVLVIVLISRRKLILLSGGVCQDVQTLALLWISKRLALGPR